MGVTPDPRRWFWSPEPRAYSRIGLVCLPGLGGDAAMFGSWPEALPPGVRLWGVRLPGHGSRMAEDPVDDPDVLVGQLADAVLSIPEPDIVLFGYSMGAVLAFELARALETAGGTPTALVVAGRGAPDADVPPVQVRNRSELVAFLRRLGGVPAEVLEDDRLLDLVLPAIEADLRLSEQYAFVEGELLSCPVLAVAGRADRLWPPDQVGDWERHTSGPFAFQVVAGGHDFIHTNPKVLISVLSQFILEKACG
ncbi:thioesterase II family protein [Actinomadura chokoriensis]|uniref:Alpha/beta fold hydrolase n=1 Tax=Actinomadura chokoriensis TaxID=454156 RepID=A0ABV4R3F6_9ACTN